MFRSPSLVHEETTARLVFASQVHVLGGEVAVHLEGEDAFEPWVGVLERIEDIVEVRVVVYLDCGAERLEELCEDYGEVLDLILFGSSLCVPFIDVDEHAERFGPRSKRVDVLETVSDDKPGLDTSPVIYRGMGRDFSLP